MLYFVDTYTLHLNSSSVNAGARYRRTYGYSVRCFKDEDVAPVQEFDVTFNPANGGDPTVIQVENGETIDSGNIPSVTN